MLVVGMAGLACTARTAPDVGARGLDPGAGISAGISTGAATTEPQPFQVDDAFRIEYAVDPRITPDGQHVVFVREVVDLMDDRWHGQLWVVDVETSEMRQLTGGHFYDSSPRISPDGSTVAFLSDRSGALQVYVKPLKAALAQRATPLTGLGPKQDPWGLAWSADGSTLSFVARELVEPPFLGRLSAPPEGAHWAPPPRIIDRLIYRQDGRGFVDDGCERVFLLPAAGGSMRRATEVEECVDEASVDILNHGRSGAGPTWAPDGRHLVVAANRRTGQDRMRHPIDFDLYEIDVQTGDLRPLVERSGYDDLPVVSPDGTKIAWIGFEDRAASFQNAEIFVANRDGSDIRSLTPKLNRDVDDPRWSADGSSIYFTYDDWGTTRIANVTLDGTRTEIASGVSDGYSAYDGGGYSVSRDGRVAFNHSSPVQAVDVAVAAADEPLRRLTGLNDDLLASRRVAPVEEIEFERTDGHRIQGWLIRPLGGINKNEATSPPPLVVDIHGGPFLNWGRRFDLEKQILAAQGLAVLYVNPRGSSGYGDEFANEIHRAYPGEDVDDLLAAVDLMVVRGEADPQRLFVSGGSGGALLTFALLAETQRFRAAVTLYPLVNWTSFALTSDIGPLVLTRWLPGPPWKHPEQYLERSPLWQVDRMTTPTLVIAGEEDYRTPISEAEQIFAALQWRGVEVVLVRLPETPHFAERRPSHYRARIAYGLHWYLSHLDSPRDESTEPVEVPAPPGGK